MSLNYQGACLKKKEVLSPSGSMQVSLWGTRYCACIFKYCIFQVKDCTLVSLCLVHCW